MSTGIKNGKHHTINIYSVKLIYSLIVIHYFIRFSISHIIMKKNG